MKTRRAVSTRLTLLLGIHLFSASAIAQVVVGTIGDSITDEYQAPESSYRIGLDGFNWVEILSRTRSPEVGFGPFDPTLDASNAPAGYAHNHAVGGAMVLNSNLPQQVAGLVADVSAGWVGAVVIWIGANDFRVRLWRGSSFDLTDPDFRSFQASFVGALTGALDALIDAGATDVVLGALGAADPNRSDLVLATRDTNDQLAAAAAARPQVTFFNPLSEFFARYDSASRSVQFDRFAVHAGAAPSSELVDPPGGVTPAQCGFDNATQAPGCPTESYQGHVLQDDGAHPTTPIQGLFANAVVGALQSRGFALTALTDAEILTISGIAPPPPLALSWRRLASKCKRASSVCRIKGRLIARNGDVFSSESIVLSFLLSDDATANAGDLLVGSRILPALEPGRRVKVKLRATLPTGVSPLGRYLIVVPSQGASFIQGPLD